MPKEAAVYLLVLVGHRGSIDHIEGAFHTIAEARAAKREYETLDRESRAHTFGMSYKAKVMKVPISGLRRGTMHRVKMMGDVITERVSFDVSGHIFDYWKREEEANGMADGGVWYDAGGEGVHEFSAMSTISIEHAIEGIQRFASRVEESIPDQPRGGTPEPTAQEG